jgi:hypothetical protein
MLILPGLPAKPVRDNPVNPAQSSSSPRFCQLQAWPCGAFIDMPIERGGNSAGVGIKQQIKNDAGELIYLCAETEQPAALK